MKRDSTSLNIRVVLNVARNAIRQDIVWHREHPGASGCSPSFESGFISGLVQAQRLLRKATKLMIEEGR